MDPAITKAIEKMGSAAKLAAALGITRSAVSQWRWIPGKHIRRVAEVTGIPLAELMDESDPASEQATQ
jgi:DNA-binding transcriptional regulator YdaS (Cro superfamily)